MPRRALVRPDEPGRQKILDAASALFGERGYDATSIADIGERAQITKSVLYHHFPSKAALCTVILEAETAAIVDAVAAAVPADEPCRLRVGVDAYLAFLDARPSAWRLLVREPPADPQLAGVYERLATERAAAIIGLLASPGKQAGDAPRVALVAVAVRTYASWWYDHRQYPRSAIVDAIVQVAETTPQR